MVDFDNEKTMKTALDYQYSQCLHIIHFTFADYFQHILSQNTRDSCLYDNIPHKPAAGKVWLRTKMSIVLLKNKIRLRRER